jgi:hypothetical protein
MQDTPVCLLKFDIVRLFVVLSDTVSLLPKFCLRTGRNQAQQIARRVCTLLPLLNALYSLVSPLRRCLPLFAFNVMALWVMLRSWPLVATVCVLLAPQNSYPLIWWSDWSSPSYLGSVPCLTAVAVHGELHLETWLITLLQKCQLITWRWQKGGEGPCNM